MCCVHLSQYSQLNDENGRFFGESSLSGNELLSSLVAVNTIVVIANRYYTFGVYMYISSNVAWKKLHLFIQCSFFSFVQRDQIYFFFLPFSYVSVFYLKMLITPYHAINFKMVGVTEKLPTRARKKHWLNHKFFSRNKFRSLNEFKRS